MDRILLEGVFLSRLLGDVLGTYLLMNVDFSDVFVWGFACRGFQWCLLDNFTFGYGYVLL